MAITQTLSSLGTPPSISEPAAFETRADALLVVALPRLVTEGNTFAAQLNTTEASINAKEASATAAAAAANTSASGAAASAAASAASRQQAEAASAAAVSARLAAEAALDAFDDKYLGAKTADPAVDNDGNALQPGAFYINATTGFIRIFTGQGWVQGISTIAGVSSFNALQGAVSASVPLKTRDGATINILQVSV